MILDAVAAFVFLFKGEFASFGRVFTAHLKFYGSMYQLMKNGGSSSKPEKTKHSV